MAPPTAPGRSARLATEEVVMTAPETRVVTCPHCGLEQYAIITHYDRALDDDWDDGVCLACAQPIVFGAMRFNFHRAHARHLGSCVATKRPLIETGWADEQRDSQFGAT